MRKSEPVRRLEIFTGAGRRRSWSSRQKAEIVAESLSGRETVSAVARRHGLTPQQLFTWRRQAGGRPVVAVWACAEIGHQMGPLRRPVSHPEFVAGAIRGSKQDASIADVRKAQRPMPLTAKPTYVPHLIHWLVR
jgi:transposase